MNTAAAEIPTFDPEAARLALLAGTAPDRMRVAGDLHLRSDSEITTNGRANVGSYLWEPHFNNDIFPDTDDEGGGVPATYVMIPIGVPSDAKSQETCQAIAYQFSAGTISTGGSPTGSIGCSNSGAQFVAWGRIAN